MPRSKKISLTLTPKKYFELIFQAFFKPTQFINQTQTASLKTALLFYSTTIILNWVLQQLVHNRESIIVFSLIPQMLFSLPLAVVVLFGLSMFLYFVAKGLGGKASFDQSLIAVCFASGTLVLSWIPLFRLFCLIWGAVLLGKIFQRIHQYSSTKALLNVALPFLTFLLIIILLGLLSFLLLFNVHQYLP